jgi:hypothetical protein
LSSTKSAKEVPSFKSYELGEGVIIQWDPIAGGWDGDEDSSTEDHLLQKDMLDESPCADKHWQSDTCMNLMRCTSRWNTGQQ